MENNKIEYFDLINHIIEYLNENDKDNNYYFTMLNKAYDIVFDSGEIPGGGYRTFGVILKKDQPYSKDLTSILYNSVFSREQEKRNEARKYLDDNNIVFCFYKDDSNANANTNTSIIHLIYDLLKILLNKESKKKYIDVDDASSAFEYINQELLDNVISKIKNEQPMSLKRTINI